MRNLVRLIPAGLLGAGAAVLVSCGSSGQGLIPAKYAGPLQGDFQAVLQAAQTGDGNCGPTEAKIRRTEEDLRSLPSTVDRGLRGRLAEGVATLSRQARAMCREPLSAATTTTGTSTTPARTATTPPPTTGTPTATTPTTEATPPSESSGEEESGATRAPGTGRDEGQGAGEAEPGNESGASGGAEAREDAAGGAGGAGGTGGATGGTGSGK
jgi:hypothetical protein